MNVRTADEANTPEALDLAPYLMMRRPRSVGKLPFLSFSFFHFVVPGIQVFHDGICPADSLIKQT